MPRLTTGLLSNDPAVGMFSAANFPGASAANITTAQNLYAFLTGRVTPDRAVTPALDSSGKYTYLGTGEQLGHLTEMAGFVQDQWRWKQNLTLNAGVRYDLQLPFVSENDSYTFADMASICGVSGTSGDRLLQRVPGRQPARHAHGVPAVQGRHAVVQPRHEQLRAQLRRGVDAAGAAGLPRSTIMGEGDFVVRAGYLRSFSRPAIGDFTVGLQHESRDHHPGDP